jgi:outer membrane protein OmpA-like peptidoglycan-associated protein
MQPSRRPFVLSLLLGLVACTAGPARELAVADMLPKTDHGSLPAAPAYIVFFDLDSAALTSDAAAILDGMAADPTRANWAAIMLAGHADRAGSERSNTTLSADRVETVRRHLLRAGIPAELIASRAHGERRALVGTPDGKPEPQNRRVEIYLREK